MPGHLRTGGYLRHVQPIALRDGITEWAHTFFQEEDSVFKYLFLKRRARSTVSLLLSSRDTPAYAVWWFRLAHPGLRQRYADFHSRPSGTGLLGCGTGLFYSTFCYRYSFSWCSSTGPSCLTQMPLASSEVEGRWQWPSLVAILFTAQHVRSG